MAAGDVFLVAGASGQLGRLVLDALVGAGDHKVIATTRTPANLAGYAERGVTVRAADYTKPKESLVEAFRGATHMLLISTQEVGARSEHHLKALDAAIEAGVRHIFYTSHSHADTSISPVAPEHGIMEKAIKARGVTYTVLRNFLYSENVLLALAESVATGTHYGVEGEGKVAWISRSDCAAAAAAAMLSAHEHENKTYDITGPRGYSNAELVAAVSNALGRPISYVGLAAEDFEATLVANGLPDHVAKKIKGLELANAIGEHELVNDMVERLTGRPPERLEDFLAINAIHIDPALTINSLLDQHAKN
jgi:NAD(P)H dehydrogenase (quinone)